MTTDDELLALAEGATEGCICPTHCDPDTIKRLIQRSKRLEEAEALLSELAPKSLMKDLEVVCSLDETACCMCERGTECIAVEWQARADAFLAERGT